MQWIPRLCDCLTVTLTLRVVAHQVPSDVALLRGVCVCVGGGQNQAGRNDRYDTPPQSRRPAPPLSFLWCFAFRCRVRLVISTVPEILSDEDVHV